jgi:chromosome segregation ATPase
MLEQQSTLISSLANVIQQNRGHQHDHFVPILEGQQAVLDKLSSLQGTQSEVTDVVARFDQLQSDVVEDLRSELVKVTTERDEHKAENHRLDLELLEARQALASAERETMESRRSFEAALSRKTTLQSDLHAAQAEKQSLSVELQSISSAQQRQAQISKKHQTDLETKQQELSDEKRRNESLAETIRLQSSELAEVRQSTSKFQETLIDRLSRIEEGVQQSTVGLGDRVVLQKENQRSQGEVDDLKMMVSLGFAIKADE